MSKNEKIKSIDKALDLLEFLSANEQETGITEISKKLHMGLSNTNYPKISGLCYSESTNNKV